jgi:hypothetical protein
MISDFLPISSVVRSLNLSSSSKRFLCEAIVFSESCVLDEVICLSYSKLSSIYFAISASLLSLPVGLGFSTTLVSSKSLSNSWMV